jgi:hypothetical protein
MVGQHCSTLKMLTQRPCIARIVNKTGLLQSAKAPEAVGIWRGTSCCHILLKQTIHVLLLKSGTTARAARLPPELFHRDHD